MNIERITGIPRDTWVVMAGGRMDERLASMMDEAEDMILDAARPRGVYRVLPIGEVPVEGYSLTKHLEDCRSAVLMAVTIGAGIDGLIRRLQVRDMAMAVMADTGASALVEAYCDAYEKEIIDEVGGYTTSRFSPGYGDSPLTLQRRVVDLLDGGRKIGLSLTPDCLMIPRKSVTAVIGMSDVPVKGRLATCGECVLGAKCTLRKEGKFCGDRP